MMTKTYKFLLCTIIFSQFQQVLCAQANLLQQKRTLTVTGSCQLKELADLAQITLTAEHLEKEAAVATRKTTEQYNEVKRALEKLKIADLQLATTQYQVYEQKDWENNKNVFKGYRALMSLQATTKEVGKMGDIIKVAAEEGITNVSQLNMTLSQTKLRQMESKCLKEAMMNAQEKASALAQNKIKLGQVLAVIEGSSGQYNPGPVPMDQAVYMKTAMMSSEAAPAPSVVGGMIDYQRTVTVVYELD